MIPQKIHYCWFGRGEKPKLAYKCIESWKEFFPSYEIIEWNEDNYDVNKIPYIAQAYQAKKYAFVSDYARFDILYNEGGLYFDTDVEVIKPFDDILENGAFMGCEIDGSDSTETDICKDVEKSAIFVNPGLGLAVAPGLRFYKDILDYYETQSFFNKDGTLNQETVVIKTTNLLYDHGLKNKKGIQNIEGISIYPKEYFNPFDDVTGKLTITENTHSIHWYSKSWMSKGSIVRNRFTRILHRFFGADIRQKLTKKKK